MGKTSFRLLRFLLGNITTVFFTDSDKNSPAKRLLAREAQFGQDISTESLMISMVHKSSWKWDKTSDTRVMQTCEKYYH